MGLNPNGPEIFSKTSERIIHLHPMKANEPMKITKYMRTVAALLLIAVSEHPMLALQPGDAVRVEALTKAEFVKGEVPKEWKTDQVYVLECWATWCGPCVAAIPHVDALYDKYHGKGLNVIGVNVFEDGKDKVAKFVQKKGDGMSYPVAYTGRGGAFEEAWLKPAGVNGIPHAFVVKNGRLLFSIHPASLTDKMVEVLLAGGEAESALVKKLHRAKGSQEDIKGLVATYSSQLGTGDYVAAKGTLSKIRDLDETYPALPGLEVGLAVRQEKWEEVVMKLDQDRSSTTAMMLGMQLETGTNALPSAVMEVLVRNLDGIEETEAIGLGVKASLLSRLGKKEEAHAAAEKAAKAFIGLSEGTVPKDAFDGYVRSFKTDKPMGLMEAFTILRQAMSKGAK
jgi:thiol-disulfide isomerase/thioredoxin